MVGTLCLYDSWRWNFVYVTSGKQRRPSSVITSFAACEEEAPATAGSAAAKKDEARDVEVPEVPDAVVDADDAALVQERRQKRIEKLKKEATSIDHLSRHTPSDPYCEICERAYMKSQSAFRFESGERKMPKEFGHFLADHCFVGDVRHYGFEGEHVMLCLEDHYTGMKLNDATESKGTENAILATQKLIGSDAGDKLLSLSCDSAPELEALANHYNVNPIQSTPYRKQANGRPEARVAWALRHIRANLEQIREGD